MSDDSVQISVRLRHKDPLERQLIDEWYDRLPSNKRGKEGVQRQIVEALCLYTGVGHGGKRAAAAPPAAVDRRHNGEAPPRSESEPESKNDDFADAFGDEI